MSPQSTVFIVAEDIAMQTSLAELADVLHLSAQCYGSAESFLDSIAPSSPGCLILDNVLPGMDGVELQEELRARKLHLPVIFVLSDANVRHVVRAMKQGAIDVFEKPINLEILKETVLHAIEIDATYREQQICREDVVTRLGSLNANERVVMEQILSGKTHKEIASDLGLSIRTVNYRRSSLMKKLNVGSRGALFELLILNKGLLDNL